MAKKGTSVNISNVSAVFISLTKLISEIDQEVGRVNVAKLHLVDEVVNAAVDQETKDMVSEILDDISQTMASVNEQSAAIKGQINKLLERAHDIQSKSRQASSSVGDRVRGTKNKLGKR